MADTIKYRFVLRRGLAADWSAKNELLLNGEFGLETDTKRLKIGDGVTPWNSLRYYSSAIGVGVLTDAASIALDASLYDSWRLTLAGNRTLANPTNLADGQVLNIRIIQDATGGRTLTYGSKFKFPGAVVPVLSTAPNSVDFMSCQYDATSDNLFCVLNNGFA